MTAEAGVTGLIFGRNIWQREHDESLRLVEHLQKILAKYPLTKAQQRQLRQISRRILRAIDPGGSSPHGSGSHGPVSVAIARSGSQ